MKDLIMQLWRISSSPRREHEFSCDGAGVPSARTDLRGAGAKQQVRAIRRSMEHVWKPGRAVISKERLFLFSEIRIYPAGPPAIG
ncbi:uncharacterized protein CIMG_11202 [Coccidioides immitis RS]|uniref:Uncharacterized protein n=4 Tax=Coccidioides immitis TaxID=5501 RepID=A0A0D8JW61_COCIM|nr:uncharacterized protein CIMG_11202 [Coccidioides immitis RS]KJF61565.1 hypothetical protein CIMG_11202 [Coccidioides immitis RS]KMP08048.1 hypothetical protein CIRG_07730 [Coccidioides immitis RMSCC 2394]KMU79664.1 hypothetical protein CISG_02081 [Coccidioides immitis RMSCC 3703]KMU85244.1 hypothetical protein CIHG_03029 [Coccidioides immitis H538.4]